MTSSNKDHLSRIEEILKKFQDVEIPSDFPLLDESTRKALPFIKKAMDISTTIYLKQQSEQLPEEFAKVMTSGLPEEKKYFRFLLGPWNPLEDYKSVFQNHPDRNKGCAFYPDHLTKDGFSSHLETLTEEEKELFSDHFSVIRHEGNKLKAIPYHVYYRDDLLKIAEHLHHAAATIDNQELKEFLTIRANSLVDGHYREADTKWVQMQNSPLELVLGPYEVYADSLMGLKATYESMLMVVDHEKGAKLKEIEKNLTKLAEIFPVPKGSKAAVGKIAPMVVVHQIYAGGEACQGIMASAFNLPNDPWVRGNIGWKQVMIYNIMQEKFNNCTLRIGSKILYNPQKIEFEPYFNFVLLHEVSHGLGPAYRANGQSVAKSIGSQYTIIEEAKADTGALYLLLHLGGQYGIPEFEADSLLNSYLAGLFRSMRFGVHEAHGAANVIQFNWFKEHGVIQDKGNHQFSIDATHISAVTDKLLLTLCEIEAAATTEETADFIKKYGCPGKDIIEAIDSISDIPIDIRVTYIS